MDFFKFNSTPNVIGKTLKSQGIVIVIVYSVWLFFLFSIEMSPSAQIAQETLSLFSGAIHAISTPLLVFVIGFAPKAQKWAIQD